MIRFTTSLTEPQHEWLNTEANRLGISPHELLRRVVDYYRDLRAKKLPVDEEKKASEVR